MTDDDQLIPATLFRKTMGNITPMTEWRWQRDPRLKFPDPIFIRGRRYYTVAAIREFQRHMTAQGTAQKCKNSGGWLAKAGVA